MARRRPIRATDKDLALLVTFLAVRTATVQQLTAIWCTARRTNYWRVRRLAKLGYVSEIGGYYGYQPVASRYSLTERGYDAAMGYAMEHPETLERLHLPLSTRRLIGVRAPQWAHQAMIVDTYAALVRGAGEAAWVWRHPQLHPDARLRGDYWIETPAGDIWGEVDRGTMGTRRVLGRLGQWFRMATPPRLTVMQTHGAAGRGRALTLARRVLALDEARALRGRTLLLGRHEGVVAELVDRVRHGDAAYQPAARGAEWRVPYWHDLGAIWRALHDCPAGLRPVIAARDAHAAMMAAKLAPGVAVEAAGGAAEVSAW